MSRHPLFPKLKSKLNQYKTKLRMSLELNGTEGKKIIDDLVIPRKKEKRIESYFIQDRSIKTEFCTE